MSDYDDDVPFILRDELLGEALLCEFSHRHTFDFWVSAAVALLGKRTGDGGYIKGEECLECLKDLQQFLQRDDPVGDIEVHTSKSEPKHPWELHR